MQCRFLLSAAFAASLMAQTPLAVIGGQPITEQDLAPFIQSELTQLRAQEYDLRSRYLEMLINQRLLETEAKKRGLTVQKLVEAEVESKVPDPPEAEINAFYENQKDRIKRPLAEVRDQVKQSIRQTKVQQVGEIYLKSLRETIPVEVLLEPPRTQISAGNRIRGNTAAPITIVEFSDFQCPFCGRVQGTLRELLAKYEGKVRLAFRDLPIQEIHPQAQSAAVAARCAGEQGRFWEFHDLIFQDQNQAKLTTAGLLEHAQKLHLNEKDFNECVASGKYVEAIQQDTKDGNQAGVSGTPGFFVNGVFLNGAVPASTFERVIEREIAAQKRRAEAAK